MRETAGGTAHEIAGENGAEHVDPAGAAVAAAETAATAAPDPAPADDRAAITAIETAVEGWAQAWSDQDVESYLAHYSAAFVPEGALTKAQWVAQRRQRIEAPRSIRVGITRLETRIESETEARVSFLQTYRSDGYSDTVDKVLSFELENGAWKIRRERAD